MKIWPGYWVFNLFGLGDWFFDWTWIPTLIWAFFEQFCARVFKKAYLTTALRQIHYEKQACWGLRDKSFLKIMDEVKRSLGFLNIFWMYFGFGNFFQLFWNFQGFLEFFKGFKASFWKIVRYFFSDLPLSWSEHHWSMQFFSV